MSFRDADNDPSFWMVTRRASRIFTLKAPKPRNYGDWTAEAIEERKWLRSLARSFAKTGTTE
jgi:hypothetical protein